MTKKDYIAIARIISDAALINLTTQGEIDANKDTRHRIAHALAGLMQRDNELFDRARFLDACGV